MKYLILLITSTLLFLSINANAASRKVMVSCSVQDAEIYANGKFMGKGSALLLVTKNVDLKVRVVANGFLTESMVFYYRKGMPAVKSHYFEMKSDDAWEASIKTEIANTDIGVNTSMKKSDAWEQLTQIVLMYFEIPEQMDEKAGYLRTAWVTNSYAQSTIRTRVIIRTASLDPLSFRVKVVSEISDRPGTKGNDDDRFKPWDRVLRKYEQLVPELQARLK